jgi:uncharacterized protein (UPF0276 family)
MGKILLGARWDEPSQNPRLNRAREAGLIDYIEANYPITSAEGPDLEVPTPVFVHCPVNPIASPHGYNRQLASVIKQAADRYDSPWIGEHLCWAGPEDEGRLGYIITPILCDEAHQIAVENILEIKDFYGRPLALELAPQYAPTGTFPSEMHFLAAVARDSDAHILLDVAHWTASNRNLGRPADYGLDALDFNRIIELHVAGVRCGKSSPFWHDSHGDVPDEEILSLSESLLHSLPALRAITFEHDEIAFEDDLFAVLEHLRRMLNEVNGQTKIAAR